MEVKKGIKFFGKLPGLLKKLNLTITLILTAATLFSYSSVWLSPSEYTIIPALAGMAFPYSLVVDVLYTLLLVFSKKWTALLMVAVLAAGYKMTDLTVRLNPLNYVDDYSKEDSSFSLMSFNVRLLDRYNWIDSKGGTRNKIFEFLKYESPEIVCFQEFFNNSKDSVTNADLISEILQTRYVIRDYDSTDLKHKTDKGYIIFSKYKLSDKQPLFDFTGNLIGMSVDAEIYGKKVRIFNFHLKSIKLGYDDYEFIDKIKDKNTKEKISGWGNIFSKMSSAYKIRVRQASMIDSVASLSPYPVILCGDFNEPPVSYCYWHIRRGFKDAFCESGTGFGGTMRVKFLTFRIDYILHSDKLKSKRFRTHTENLSDHYPISCKFKFSE